MDGSRFIHCPGRDWLRLVLPALFSTFCCTVVAFDGESTGAIELDIRKREGLGGGVGR